MTRTATAALPLGLADIPCTADSERAIDARDGTVYTRRCLRAHGHEEGHLWGKWEMTGETIEVPGPDVELDF